MSLWESLLATAIHAPSPHNVQPWRVRILNDNEVDIFIDSARTLPKEDPIGSFIILTMGMFIEGLRILAAAEGYDLEQELVHEAGWYAPAILDAKEQTFLPFARLRLRPNSSSHSSFDPALFLHRRTSRISSFKQPVTHETVIRLKALSKEWEQEYFHIADSHKIERILQKNTEALFEDLNNRDYHDEIVEWFRFTDRSARRERDGLDYRCMNSSRVAYWLAARIPRLLLFRLTRPLLWKQYRAQLGIVPAIGVLSGKFWEPEEAFKTGSFLMHFWLETARQNLYIHPYGNLVTNNKAARWLEEETGISEIWLIFKIGYSPEPPKSYRRPLQEILLA